MTINQAITRCKCNALNIFPLQNDGIQNFLYFFLPFCGLGGTAVYLKIKFTPNLLRQLAAFFTPNSELRAPKLPCQTFNFMNWIMPELELELELEKIRAMFPSLRQAEAAQAEAEAEACIVFK